MYGVLGLTFVLVALCYTNAAQRGGWSDISVDDAKVVELSNWAVGKIGNGYALREIRAAEYQVVSGKNYKLVLGVDVGEGLQSTCIILIWEKLDGTREIKEPTACTY